MKKLCLILLVVLMLLFTGCDGYPLPSESLEEYETMDMWEAFRLLTPALGGDGYYKPKTYDEAIEHLKGKVGNVATIVITVEKTQNILRHMHDWDSDNGYTEITYTIDDIKYQYNFMQEVGKSYKMRTSTYFEFRNPAKKREYLQRKYNVRGKMVFNENIENDVKTNCVLPDGDYEVELIKGHGYEYILRSCVGDIFAEGEQYIVIAHKNNKGIVFTDFAVPYRCDDIEGYFREIYLNEFAFPERDEIYRELFEKFGIAE